MIKQVSSRANLILFFIDITDITMRVKVKKKKIQNIQNKNITYLFHLNSNHIHLYFQGK